MNTYEADDNTIAKLTSIIPTDCWLLPSLADFGAHFPLGGTDRGMSLRVRSAMGLPPAERRGNSTTPVIIGSPRGRSDIIARANCRVHGGDRYLWRRYAPGTDHAEIERDGLLIIKQVHRTRIDHGARIKPAQTASAPTLGLLPEPAAPLPARPASTSVSRMPTPELRRLRADADDELARRGDLPEPEMAAVVTPAPLTDEIAWSHLQARLSAGISPEMLRRIAADSAAAVQRQREAAQAAIEAAQAAMAAAQAELARLG